MDAVAASSINHSDMIENKGAVHNQCLDFFKGLACIFVVFIHVIFPEPFESLGIYTFGSAAVPLFFMIAGYYLYHEDRAVVAKRIPKRARKILFYAILYYVLYAIFEIVLGIMNGTGGGTECSQYHIPFELETLGVFCSVLNSFFWIACMVFMGNGLLLPGDVGHQSVSVVSYCILFDSDVWKFRASCFRCAQRDGKFFR